MTKKLKVLTLSDHPLSPSGVGTQTKYICEALLDTGRYSVVSLGGAIKHSDYNPSVVEPYGEDWRVFPVDGYGTPEMIRSILRTEKPDVLWFMTDPRFWGWLWMIENEVRPIIPMIYYHVWDNKPYPYFNKKFYDSNDHVVTISKVTDDIVRTVSPDIQCTYHPHSVDTNIFKPISAEEKLKLRESSLHPDDHDKIIFMWNNRNARRKQSGTLIWWFKEWLDKRDLHTKAQLIMHTEPRDPHGQDLHAIIKQCKLDQHRQVLLSTVKVSPNQLSAMYGMADCTINISDAEGFGLSTLESLACGTPIIVNMTGGLQEQITDGNEWFGMPVYPSSKSVIGSQEVPYIYEDRINRDHFHSALDKMLALGKEGRRKMGLKGRQHVMNNYNFTNYKNKWVEIFDSTHEKFGSWSGRKEYNGIRFKEVA